MLPYAVYKSLPSAAQKALKKQAAAAKPKVRKAAVQVYENVKKEVAKPNSKKNWGEMAMKAMPLALGIAKIAGFGDYAPMTSVPNQNSFMRDIMANGPPAIHSTKQRSFILRHREYLGDVITGATAAFNIANYNINPGLGTSFPWLSVIAQNFEQYRFHGLIYEFKSTSSDALNSTNTALGSVIMATEYNADSEPFLSKVQMENKEFCNSSRQSCSMLHAVECDRSKTPVSELYVRQGELPEGQDLKFTDLGVFSIATVGQQGANVNIGELWVTYEVELLKPQIPDSQTGVQFDFFEGNAGISASAYLGSAPITVSNNIGCQFTGGDTIEFPVSVYRGVYLISYFWSGASTTGPAPPGFTVVGGVELPYWPNNPDLTTRQRTATSVGSNSEITIAVQVTSNTCTVQLTGGTVPTSVDYASLRITRSY